MLDVVASALILLFGLYVLVQAWQFGITSETGPGSGTFPLVAGAFITIFSVLNLTRSIRTHSTKKSVDPTDSELDVPSIHAGELGKVVIIVTLIAIYLALFPILGAFLHLPLLMIAVSLVIHWRTDLRWLVTIAAISVLFTIACYYIFEIFLRVLLPEGPFGF